MQKYAIFFRRKFQGKCTKDKKHHKVRDHCNCTDEFRGAAHIMCNLKYGVPKEIYINFL